MSTELLPLIAGLTSSTLFASSHFPMLWKAYRTRNVSSYSGLNFVLVNIGNLIFWMYIVTLPMGPIWFLHAFYTVSTAIMLAMYVRFAGRNTQQLRKAGVAMLVATSHTAHTDGGWPIVQPAEAAFALLSHPAPPGARYRRRGPRHIVPACQPQPYRTHLEKRHSRWTPTISPPPLTESKP